MEQLSGYEIAQQRIESRQRRRYRAGVWVALFIIAGVFLMLAGAPAAGCIIPLMVCFGFFSIMDGIQIYFASPRQAPSKEMVMDEMGWLFGDDWRDVAGTQEFMLAQERIRRRRIRRAYFFVDLIAFFVVNAGLLFLIGRTFNTYSASSSAGCLTIFVIGWLLFLGGHAVMVFPSRRRLTRDEHRIGQAILAEMQRSVPDLEKRKDKPKRDAQYRVGEDGELVEVDYEFTFDEEEKSKRDSP